MVGFLMLGFFLLRSFTRLALRQRVVQILVSLESARELSFKDKRRTTKQYIEL